MNNKDTLQKRLIQMRKVHEENRPREMKDADFVWYSVAYKNGIIAWWSDKDKVAVCWDGKVVCFGQMVVEDGEYIIIISQEDAIKADIHVAYDLFGWEV